MYPTRLAHTLAELPPRTKVWVMILGDALFLPLCVVLAVAMRLSSMREALDSTLSVQLALGLLTLPVLGAAGLYRAVVRYIDLTVLRASGAALALAVLLIYAAAHLLDVYPVPRSALLIYWFVAFTYVVSSRFIVRSLLRRTGKYGGRPRLRTAIYGAGNAGVQLARTMEYSPEYKAVCFIDDAPALRGKTVTGLHVYPSSAIAEAAFRHDVSLIVVAIPSASSARKRELIQRIEHAGLPVRILPGLVELVDGRASVSDIREVNVADLLGRDPVPPDASLFARNIAGKVVLVTGAGGSIGSELCRQIVSQRPRLLVLLDHSEFALYSIDQELRQVQHRCDLVPCLGSVLDTDLVLTLLRQYAVQTIYHAAAYKHVPLVEANVKQGLRNNVFGSLNVARAALDAGVETCILVSTDKAVRPTNVMGTSKRIAELVFQAAAARSAGRTTFAMVRFGNVLGSSGSVVPLFKKQIQAGGPVTITHPEVIRYFMLIGEAAQLVIQAGALARGGEVFVLDMGEPVRIADLARTMIRLSGLSERTADRPDGDIEIAYVGLRPGEKLYEELLIGEHTVPSGHPRIQSAMERFIDPALLDKMLTVLQQTCEQNDLEAIQRQIRNIVPEYKAAEEVVDSRPGALFA